jgi:hypothetical protein
LWLILTRGPRISQISCTARVDTKMDRRQIEPAWETTPLRLSWPKDLWTIWCSSHSKRTGGAWYCLAIYRPRAAIRSMRKIVWTCILSLCKTTA